jgi:hypothetical protein
VRRWIAKTSDAGPGGYWCLYEGTLGARTLVATVCKFVTRWRGYVHSESVVSRHSHSQDTAQAAARWVIERLDERAQGAA